MDKDEKFFEKTNKNGPMNVAMGSRCWIWNGNKNDFGYGRYYFNGCVKYAHRFAYEMTIGPIPERLVIDHLCRNRLCVNPHHLELVDIATNVLRGDTIASHRKAQTHCARGHPLSDNNLRIYRGKRYCKECQRINKNINKHRAIPD